MDLLDTFDFEKCHESVAIIIKSGHSSVEKCVLVEDKIRRQIHSMRPKAAIKFPDHVPLKTIRKIRDIIFQMYT